MRSVSCKLGDAAGEGEGLAPGLHLSDLAAEIHPQLEESVRREFEGRVSMLQMRESPWDDPSEEAELETYLAAGWNLS